MLRSKATPALRCRLRLRLALATSFLVLAACVSAVERGPVGGSTAMVARGSARAAWRVVDGDAIAGSVLRYQEDGGSRTWFSVRNSWSQELGIVDSDGRAWRHRAHEREPDWLGTGTIADGARRILAASPNAKLVACAPSELGPS